MTEFKLSTGFQSSRRIFKQTFPFQVNIWMVDRLRAFDFRWVVWVVGVDDKGEEEGATLVHAFVGCYGQGEVKEIGRIREGSFHGGW